MQNSILKKITVAAVMGAIGFVLMLLEFSLPFVPPFLKLDFSELPCLIAAFAAGPLFGVISCVIKNLLHLLFFFSNSAGVGELANLLIGAAFCFTAGIIYKYKKTKIGALLSCVIGSVAGAMVSIPLNCFVVYPLYVIVYGMPMPAIISMYSALCSYCDNLIKSLLVFNLPFTFGKFAIDSAVCFLVYKRISPLLKS